MRPAWVRDDLFPFTSRFVEVGGNRVHYVDEGTGPVILMLHGNVTWSFLYRDVIRGLSDVFRCIAIDYPGFGLSQPGADFQFTAAEQVAIVEGFVEQLDLRDVTPMMWDWGGPIGLLAAARAPHRYQSFVIANTWAWPAPAKSRMERFSKVMGSPPVRHLIRRFPPFVDVAIRVSHRRRRLTSAEVDHYRRPLGDADGRGRVQLFAKEVVGATPLFEELEQRLPALTDRPALIVWVQGDIAFRQDAKRRFEQLFPHHSTIDVRGAGHHVMDDASDEVVSAVRSWKGMS